MKRPAFWTRDLPELVEVTEAAETDRVGAGQPLGAEIPFLLVRLETDAAVKGRKFRHLASGSCSESSSG